MKNGLFFLRGRASTWLLGAGTLLFTACAIGYDSPNGFDSGVHNQQMETPESVSFTVSVSGTSASITWPLVIGAKGYEVSFYNVDDPENPVVIDGYEKTLVDGSSITVNVEEDCNYRLELRALGNEEYKNTDDETAQVFNLSTLVPSVATIPNGSDIYEYLQQHPYELSNSEIAIDLEAGGTYTCSGPVDFGGQLMTFRGNKLNRAEVHMTGNGAFYSYNGLKLKYINFDCAESTANSLFFMSNGANAIAGEQALPDSIKSQNLGYARDGSPINDIYIVTNPVYIASCWIKDLPKAIIHDNSVNCAWWYFVITDCIIQEKNNTNNPFINLQSKGKCIKHIQIDHSTIFNTLDNGSAYWLRYNNSSNSQQVKVFGNTTSAHSSGSVSLLYTTFSKTFSKQRMANNNNANGMTTTVSHCIFYDVRGISKLACIGVKSFSFNFYYAFTSPETSDATQKDNSSKPFASVYDPQFVGDVLQSLDFSQPNGGVNFTPQEREVIVNSGGDPRWLPTY
jgi:hypothetical protein